MYGLHFLKVDVCANTGKHSFLKISSCLFVLSGQIRLSLQLMSACSSSTLSFFYVATTGEFIQIIVVTSSLFQLLRLLTYDGSGHLHVIRLSKNYLEKESFCFILNM